MGDDKIEDVTLELNFDNGRLKKLKQSGKERKRNANKPQDPEAVKLLIDDLPDHGAAMGAAAKFGEDQGSCSPFKCLKECCCSLIWWRK